VASVLNSPGNTPKTVGGSSPPAGRPRKPRRFARSETGLRCNRLDVVDFAAVAALSREFGRASIDALIANAGVAGPRGMTPESIDAAGWGEIFRVNAMAPLALAGAFAPQVARSEQR
jgi:NAD(P)-dependent dehydrogenase (short-subunit alcohol dehydrogenase family)